MTGDVVKTGKCHKRDILTDDWVPLHLELRSDVLYALREPGLCRAMARVSLTGSTVSMGTEDGAPSDSGQVINVVVVDQQPWTLAFSSVADLEAWMEVLDKRNKNNISTSEYHPVDLQFYSMRRSVNGLALIISGYTTMKDDKGKFYNVRSRTFHEYDI